MRPEMPVVRSSSRVVHEPSWFWRTLAFIESPGETDMVWKSTSGYSGYSSHQAASLRWVPPSQSLLTPVWSSSPEEPPAPPIPTQVDSPALGVCLQFSLGTVNCPETAVTGVAEGTT